MIKLKKNNISDNIQFRIADAILVTGETTVNGLLKRPGIRAAIESIKNKITSGKLEELESIDEVYQTADEIIALLHSMKVNIKRLAIDGVPGSGKSTLARSLADRLHFIWKSLDYQDMDSPIDFSKKKTIYEHHRLLRTQDLENFDAIIYIDEPLEISKLKCLHRKRGGYNIDIFDYEKLKKIGKKAFEIANGSVYQVKDSYIKIKLKPSQGFQSLENLKKEIHRENFDIDGLSKEELLFLSEYGKKNKGLRAYVKIGAYNNELLEGITAGILKFLRG